MTILEALAWGEGQLKKTENEKTYTANPKLDAQVLLGFCLGKSSTYVFAHFDEPIQDDALEKFQRAIKRRQNHEPVAYITQKKEFYKRPFFVNAFTLIPRPETEHLVDLVIEKSRPGSEIIEVGTGSGAIAVTLAAELNQSITAIEIDQDTLAVAKHNAETNKVETFIDFKQGNLLEPYMTDTSSKEHGIIVANLPYVPMKHWNGLDPDVVNYEPKNAIVSGVDGLDLYDELLQQVSKKRDHFPKSVDVLMEMDPSQEITLPRLAKEHFPNSTIEVLYDLADKARITAVHL